MKRKLLFVFAHPDDESFGCGGTMAKYKEQGHDILLICATSGCGGRSGEYSFQTKQELAAHRENELRQACSILGVSQLVLLCYPDGKLKEQNPDELAHRIEEVICDHLPDLVITFPPNGVTGHLDHIAISKATKQAVESAEHRLPRERWPSLYYVSIPHYYDHCAASAPAGATPITAKVHIENYRNQKGKALQAHRSQAYSVNRAYPGVMQGDYRVIGHYEYYTLCREAGEAVEIKEMPEGIPVKELV